MGDDLTVPQSLHRVHQNVPGGRLHDVLHELGTVGFDALPFLRATDPFICDGLTAESVLADTGLDVDKVSAGRKRYETEFKVCNDKVYLSPVLDLFNREIIYIQLPGQDLFANHL